MHTKPLIPTWQANSKENTCGDSCGKEKVQGRDAEDFSALTDNLTYKEMPLYWISGLFFLALESQNH